MALTALLTATVTAATASALSHGRTGSGINGRVIPCGIVLERPAPCAHIPARSVAIGRGHRLVRTVKVHQNGSFQAPLEAGSYWLQARSSKTRGPRVRATVPDGQWITVALMAGRLSPPAAR
jgi:hypothetical protein